MSIRNSTTNSPLSVRPFKPISPSAHPIRSSPFARSPFIVISLKVFEFRFNDAALRRIAAALLTVPLESGGPFEQPHARNMERADFTDGITTFYHFAGRRTSADTAGTAHCVLLRWGRTR